MGAERLKVEAKLANGFRREFERFERFRFDFVRTLSSGECATEDEGAVLDGDRGGCDVNMTVCTYAEGVGIPLAKMERSALHGVVVPFTYVQTANGASTEILQRSSHVKEAVLTEPLCCDNDIVGFVSFRTCFRFLEKE